MTQDRQQRLLDLILEVSFERRKVTLASGKESDFYLDLRQTLMRPLGTQLAGELVLAQLMKGGTRVDSVGGMAVGAVPLVSAVLGAAAAADPATPLVGFFIRKQAKGHGLAKQIEGGFASGQTVALVEDTTTTGGSTLDAVDAVEAAGGKVARVLCLVDRGEGRSRPSPSAGSPWSRCSGGRTCRSSRRKDRRDRLTAGGNLTCCTSLKGLRRGEAGGEIKRSSSLNEARNRRARFATESSKLTTKASHSPTASPRRRPAPRDKTRPLVGGLLGWD